MNDLWRPVKNYPNYLISRNGVIKNNINNLVIKQQINKNGYLFVGLYNNGERKMKKVHRLLADAFIDNPNNYNIVDHIDRNKNNNTINNLRWCTQSENMRNRKINKNNNSGVKGISRNKGYWICQYNDEVNKQINKYFSIAINGFNDAKFMAMQYRSEKERELNYIN
jgi:hypothetical protein